MTGRDGSCAATKIMGLVGLCVLAAGLASCSTASGGKQATRSKEYFPESKYGKASPRIVNGENVPRGGGRYMVGDPYQVAGKTYVPRENPRYDKVGRASWYGSAFHGRATANGEVYDRKYLSAAHPTLPLPSYARVTNVENGSSVVVRINDRGPFHSDRIIDLSQKTAELLDMSHSGTAKVRVQYIGTAPLEGNDAPYLMASYVRKGDRFPLVSPETGYGGSTMVAQNSRQPRPAEIAAATPVPRAEPRPAAGPATAARAPQPNSVQPPYPARQLQHMAQATAPQPAAPAIQTSLAGPTPLGPYPSVQPLRAPGMGGQGMGGQGMGGQGMGGQGMGTQGMGAQGAADAFQAVSGRAASGEAAVSGGAFYEIVLPQFGPMPKERPVPVARGLRGSFAAAYVEAADAGSGAFEAILVRDDRLTPESILAYAGRAGAERNR